MKDRAKAPRTIRRWRLFGLGIVLALVLIAADYLIYPLLSPAVGYPVNQGENGLWLRYTWYFGEWAEADLARLAQRLRDGQIRYAYCHVRYIQADGRLHFKKPDEARRFVAGLHCAVPSLKVLAWVYAGNLPGKNRVDLTSATVRKTMVDEAGWLVKKCGFDGIQWDYEICPDGDQGHVSLLKETRAALPKGAILAACTPMWYPGGITRKYGWSEDYFAQVAASCDQLAVMGYDSAFFLPRAYVWLIRQQTVRVPRAATLGNPHCRVLIGLPTYEGGGASHHLRAENIRMALKGVRQGVSDPQLDATAFAGVALFADYTTTPDEWSVYRDLWPMEPAK
jgi:hypothetical protein